MLQSSQDHFHKVKYERWYFIRNKTNRKEATAKEKPTEGAKEMMLRRKQPNQGTKQKSLRTTFKDMA